MCIEGNGPKMRQVWWHSSVYENRDRGAIFGLRGPNAELPGGGGGGRGTGLGNSNMN